MDTFVLVHMWMYIIASAFNIVGIISTKNRRLPFRDCFIIVGHMMLGFWAYNLLYPINFFD